MTQPVVFGQSLTLDQAPRRRRSARLSVVCLLLALAAGILLADVARADDGDRYEPTSRGDRAAVEQLAEAHFPPELVGWAMRTASCETGGTFNLYAHSAGYDARFGVFYEHVGPWQVSVPTWAGKAWELFGGSLWDPDVGAAMAAWIATNLGVGHWPVCGR